MHALTTSDYLGLGWFLLCWVGYTRIADYSRWHNRSIMAAMNRYRIRWMQVMLRRDDPRIVDTTIVASLLSGIAFFASTSIIVVGGLIAMLGATDQAMRVLESLPLVAKPSRTIWDLKVLLLITIFIYAFFKFAWSFRLLKYCSILIGATAPREELDETDDTLARSIGELISIEAVHFNQGLRAFFFALAALGWFLHPWVWMLASAWVTLVLYRREFRSRSLACLKAGEQGIEKPAIQR